MIVALDIETIPNPDMIERLPVLEVKDKRITKPDTIAAKLEEMKADQVSDMALDGTTGRVLCCAMHNDDAQHIIALAEATDESERVVIIEIMETLAVDGMRLVTFNGIGFDLPFIYRRAMMLGVAPKTYGAPPLTYWTKRYSTDTHFDLMQIWQGWSGFVGLDALAGLILGERKTEIDVTKFAEMMKTPEGMAMICGYCQRDTELTWKLYKAMAETLFA